MSRKLIVEVVGDTSQFEKSMQRSSRAATSFSRDVSKATRGAAAGSGVFRSFGRSIAFASGGFLAFESATAFLRASVDAAREAAVAQRSLAAQMKASGESFAVNRDRIEEAARSYAKFGFQNDEVIQSLTVLERGTGSINRALLLQGGVADIARAKDIRLADAAAIVAKALSGQETALRRAVPGLPKLAHGADLVRLAFAKMAGQAAANTTVSEQFAATLHDTQEIIGTALLPTLNKYLAALSTWMADTRNQEKLQKAANSTAKAGADVFDALSFAIGNAAAAYDKWQALRSKLPGGKGGILGTVFGGELALVQFYKRQALRLGRLVGIGGGGGAQAITGGPAFEAFMEGIRRNGVLGGPAGRRPLSLAGRFNLAELRLAQAGLTKTLSDDRKILVVEKAIVEQQIKSAKTLKDKTKLTLQLVGITSQILSIDTQAAQAAADRAQKRKDAAEKARQARQQFQLPPGLQVAQARADAFAALQVDLQGPTRLQLKLAQQAKAAALKAINSHKLLYQGLIDAWNIVAQANQTLAQKLKGGIQGTYAAVSTRAVTEGLNLTRLQRVALEGRLAQRAAHRGFAPVAGAALGQPIEIHTHVSLDGRAVGTSVEKYNRQTHQRRGTRR